MVLKTMVKTFEYNYFIQGKNGRKALSSKFIYFHAILKYIHKKLIFKNSP